MVESERLIILLITGTRTEDHTCKREVGIGSGAQFALGREFKNNASENLER